MFICGPAGPILGNLLVAGAGGIITLLCIAAAVKMILFPGETSADHPKRRILGFACPRSEVSGRRLWKLFAQRFGSPEKFFTEHFVVNYCPLAFLAESGANLTPNKLPRTERENLFAFCDDHLRRVLEILEPEWLIGVGGFAQARGELVVAEQKIRVGQILHPSPASPKANRQDWTKTAAQELIQQGVWK